MPSNPLEIKLRRRRGAAGGGPRHGPASRPSSALPPIASVSAALPHYLRIIPSQSWVRGSGFSLSPASSTPTHTANAYLGIPVSQLGSGPAEKGHRLGAARRQGMWPRLPWAPQRLGCSSARGGPSAKARGSQTRQQQQQAHMVKIRRESLSPQGIGTN